MAVSEEWIKNRAYALWEEEGRPHGKDTEHWERAAQEYTSMNGAAQTAKPARKTKASEAKTPKTATAAEVSEPPAKTKPAARKKAAPKGEDADANPAPTKRTRKTPAA